MICANLLDLPIELICNTLSYLSLQDISFFARTSKRSLKVFKFDFKRIILQAITQWEPFLFICPACGKAARMGSEKRTRIFQPESAEIEKDVVTCKPCYFLFRKDAMKVMNSFLVSYRENRDSPSLYRSMAFKGILRYAKSKRYPRKRDFEFMKSIVKKIYFES